MATDTPDYIEMDELKHLILQFTYVRTDGDLHINYNHLHGQLNELVSRKLDIRQSKRRKTPTKSTRDSDIGTIRTSHIYDDIGKQTTSYIVTGRDGDTRMFSTFEHACDWSNHVLKLENLSYG